MYLLIFCCIQNSENVIQEIFSSSLYFYISYYPNVNKIGAFFFSSSWRACGLFFAIKRLRLSVYMQYLYGTSGSSRLIDEERVPPFHLLFLSFSSFFSSASSSASSSSPYSFFGATHTRGDKVEDDRRSK